MTKNINQQKWTNHFMEMAKLASTMSKDTTKIGAVIIGERNEVRSTGYNGLPRGVKDLPERMERPIKYLWTEHAERNAIYNASLNGTSLLGTTIYIWGANHPCPDCARAIIQSGITTIVMQKENEATTDKNSSLNKKELYDISLQMLKEAEINIISI